MSNKSKTEQAEAARLLWMYDCMLDGIKPEYNSPDFDLLGITLKHRKSIISAYLNDEVIEASHLGVWIEIDSLSAIKKEFNLSELRVRPKPSRTITFTLPLPFTGALDKSKDYYTFDFAGYNAISGASKYAEMLKASGVLFDNLGDAGRAWSALNQACSDSLNKDN